MTINGSGETNVGVDGNPGYIYVPYILQSSTTVISGGNAKYWVRISQIRKRREKIEKIMNRINGTVCD